MQLDVRFTHRFKNWQGKMVDLQKWATIDVNNIDQNTLKQELDNTGCFGKIIGPIIVEEAAQ